MITEDQVNVVDGHGNLLEENSRPGCERPVPPCGQPGRRVRLHGVRHLEQARFLLFDNLGAAGAGGPSRLLMIDLATGAETTLFPNDGTPEHLRDWFTVEAGQFDVSADRRRALRRPRP